MGTTKAKRKSGRRRDLWNPPFMVAGTPPTTLEGWEAHTAACSVAGLKKLYPGRQNKKNLEAAVITFRQGFYRRSLALRRASQAEAEASP